MTQPSTTRRVSRSAAAALAIAMLLPGAMAAAAEWDVRGHIGIESRFFPNDPDFAGQDDDHVTGSIFAEPEFVYEFNDGNDRLTLTPFARLDSHDDNRTHADLRQANWLHIGDGWDLVVGIEQVFWGVTESRHLVDIINQTDTVDAVDGERKLGQPMVNLNLLSDFGTFRFYALPGFRERTFPDDDARLRGPLPIDGNAKFGNNAGRDRVDLAFRYTNSFGPFDVGLAHFHGNGREPSLVLKNNGGDLEFEPFYQQIDQTSIDLQATFGDWLWKVEAMTRSGQGNRINAFVGGFEYTIFNALGTTADLGLLGEYLYDDRDFDDFAAFGAGVTFDDDIFGGVRLRLNDIAGSELLAGVIVDHGNGTTVASLEASRRITDLWRIELEARGFFNVDDQDIVRAVSDDDYVSIRLKRFF